MLEFQVGETRGSITNVEVKTLFFAQAWMFCSSHAQQWGAILTFFLFFSHCHFILPLSRLLIYPGGDALKETFINGKSPSNKNCFEEQCSKGTSMHHEWQPIHAFKFKEWLKYLLKWMFLQNIAKQQQQQNCWRECIRK
jgi:hypothetical protein